MERCQAMDANTQNAIAAIEQFHRRARDEKVRIAECRGSELTPASISPWIERTKLLIPDALM